MMLSTNEMTSVGNLSLLGLSVRLAILIKIINTYPAAS